MTVLIERLEAWAIKDSKVRAILQRSLAFDPGQFPRAYPFVEPFLQGESNWSRDMHYLVAGLWAAHWREDCSKQKISIARACAEYGYARDSASTEGRFIAVIDADSDQLPHRIRQLVALLKEYPIDFAALLKDLMNWNGEKKTIQNAWAREFYRVSYADKQEKI